MLPISAAVFFTSGFAALLYQVIWQRLLVLFSGADLYSVTIIVASFMGGMGVGHLAGGHVADRVKPVTALLCFAGAELAIALFGFFSRALYYDFLYDRVGDAQIAPAVLPLLLFASLYGGLINLLDDGRIEQIFGDGRIHLRRGGPYDIIEADALRPGSAYSGTLYSDAYFALLRDRLAPNGLAATWRTRLSTGLTTRAINSQTSTPICSRRTNSICRRRKVGGRWSVVGSRWWVVGGGWWVHRT